MTAALLVLVAVAAYWPALTGGMLLDDITNIARPELAGTHGLWRVWFDIGATQQYYPIVHTLFWLQRTLWGDAMLGYHLISLTAHVGSALLVVVATRQLGLRGGWIAAFIFALHPLMVESAAWVSEQKNTWSTLFALGAACTYWRARGAFNPRTYALASALFVLAVLSKTPTAALPAALLVVQWWRVGRLEWRKDVVPLLPWFGFAVLAGAVTIWVEHRYIGAHGDDFALGFAARGLVAARALCFYVETLVWPVDLWFFYPRWTVDPRTMWPWAAVVVAIIVATAVAARGRGRRGPAAALLLFVGLLFPALGFVNIYWFAFSYVADHFAYAASLALIVPLAVLAARLDARWSGAAKIVGRAFGLAVLATLSALTWRQCHLYRDYETLVAETVAHNPGAWLFQNALGVHAARANRFDEAVTRFQAARQVRPNFAEASYNLAMAYERLPGRTADAIAAYRDAIRLQPRYADAYFNLGNLLANGGQFADAVTQFAEAVKLKPDHLQARLNLGMALENCPGRAAEALPHFEAAARLDPQSVDARLHYALSLANAGNLSAASTELEALLRAHPACAPARDLLQQIRAAKPM